MQPLIVAYITECYTTAMKKRRAFREMRNTALERERIGMLDKQTMKQFDTWMLPPVHDLTPGEIRALREQNRVSQAVFAALLNTSISTVQKWEIGDKRPSGPSLKLLNMIQRKGIDAIY